MKDVKLNDVVVDVAAIVAVVVVSCIGVNFIFKWWIWCLSLAGAF